MLKFKNIRCFGWIMLLFFLFGATCSCAKKEKALSPEEIEWSREIRIPLVQLCEVSQESSICPQTFSGTAKEGRTIQMGFRVHGPVVSLKAKIGEMVEEGEELARLDQRDFLNTLAVVEAGIAEVQAGLDAKTASRDGSVAMLQKQLDAASVQLATVEKNLKKFTELEKKGAVPEIKLDELKLQHEQALAAKVAAEKQLENGIKGLDEEINGYEAKKKGLLAQKKQAEDALSDTILRAPCRGFVTQKYVEEGELIAPSVPILAFTDVSEILVQTTIPESLLVRQNEFVSYRCSFEAYPGVSFEAELSSLGKALQTGGYGYPLEVRFQAVEEMTIYPGMAASVTINFEPKKGEFLVPLVSITGDYVVPRKGERADEYDGESRESIVWSVSPENKVVKRKVKIERLTEEGAVVTGEVSAGDKIVGPGARFLREGQTVRVLN